MEIVLEIVVLGRAARNAANIKNRQPIGRMFVKAAHEVDGFFREIVESELNIKKVIFKEDMEEYLSYSFKPQFKVLGPKVGRRIGEVKAALLKINGHAAKEELDRTGKLILPLAGGDITLLPGDIEVSMAQTEGFVSQRYGTVTVALETTLAPELIEEGFVREIISKVQTMRKENGFEVTDHIRITAGGNEKITALMAKNEDYIKSITLANEISYEKEVLGKEWNINGEKLTLKIE